MTNPVPIPIDTLPTVAVVVPCYNAERWISRVVQSAIDQRYPGLEIVVVDDGSTDRSVAIVQSFGEGVRCKTGPNCGACVARNAGLAATTADYVMFLDADDYLEPDSLRHWAKAAHSANAHIVFGPLAYEQDSKIIPAQPLEPPATSEHVLRQWLQGWFIPPCSILWRRSFVESIGGWNTAALRNQDGELVMRALILGARVAICDAGRGIYVQHDTVGRISRRGGRNVLASELESFRNLWALAQAREGQQVQTAFASAFYRLAYQSFASHVDDIGQAALAEARALGLNGHIGSVLHRLLAGVVGLRGKLRLTGILKGRH
jgi:glycosyltransferase involved in cell wall biosynthesis